MKRLKTYSFISLDGYITQTNGDVDWLYEFCNPLDKAFKYIEFKESSDCVLVNRPLFNMLESYYNSWPFDDIPCYLFTEQTIQTPKDKPVRVVRTNSYDSTMILPFVKELQKEKSEKDIWVAGDQELINMLIQFGMIDEMNLIIIPKTLGSGASFFAPHGVSQQWKLANNYTSSDGAIKLSYIKA